MPAKVAETQKTAEAPQVAATQVTEAPKAEAPKYVERPALVEPKTETTQGSTVEYRTGKAGCADGGVSAES